MDTCQFQNYLFSKLISFMFLFNTVYNIRPRGINIRGAKGINKLWNYYLLPINYECNYGVIIIA